MVCWQISQRIVTKSRGINLGNGLPRDQRETDVLLGCGLGNLDQHQGSGHICGLVEIFEIKTSICQSCVVCLAMEGCGRNNVWSAPGSRIEILVNGHKRLHALLPPNWMCITTVPCG